MPHKPSDKRTDHRGHGKRNINPGTFGRLLSQMGAHRFKLVLVLLCILLSALSRASTSLFLRALIDDEIMPMIAQGSRDFSGIIRIVVAMSIVYGIGILTIWVYNRIMVTVEQSTVRNIRDNLFAHVQTLPVRYFDTHAHGDIMSRFTSDVDTLRAAISQSFPSMVSSLLSTLAAFGAMMYLSLSLTLFVVLFSVLLFVLVKAIVRRSAKYFMSQQIAMGDVNAYVEEIIEGQKVVKVFNYENKAIQAFGERTKELFNNASQALKYGMITMPVVVSMGFLLYVLIGILGGAIGILGIPNWRLTGSEAMTVGTIISFITLSRSFVNPIGQISMQFNTVVQALAGASRIFQVMGEESEHDTGVVTLVYATKENGELTECCDRTDVWAWKIPQEDGSFTYTELKGDIRFYDVNFSYVQGKPVLRDINLYAKPGQKVALVGATGAGKTTITNLLNRFYDIDEGAIHYDGIDIREIKKADLRKSLGVVLQEIHLFTGTVMDNIRYGKLDATDEECIRAAKLVNADGFIRMLPHGYNTMLEGDGSGLSQGQRQLIAIARAAVLDPPVMILDEATSSIDTRTESIVQQGMDALMHGRTNFAIAHRLSTVRDADVIMVMEDGCIIERGTHEQLIEEGGQYYRLHIGAFELE
ncbi:MAG TPA: ABC transporter ATP-binding protein [Bacillota bacterium]|nr:ABC transporter ATP-binding protein [Bacillota bacterium]HQC48398.1 ABC transporter ATP-binding protein [Bacillota bacterium]